MSNLLKENKNGWETVTEAEKQSIFDFCEGYKEFIDNAKTERQAVKSAVEIAKKHDLSHTLKRFEEIYKIAISNKSVE